MAPRHWGRRTAGLTILANLVWACGVSDTACTLIGCSSGLIVRVSGLPEGPATLTLQVEGQPPVIRACSSAELCELPGVQFTDQTPANATVLVTSGEFSKSFTISNPAYEDLRPNGADCPPVCRSAVVTLSA